MKKKILICGVIIVLILLMVMFSIKLRTGYKAKDGRVLAESAYTNSAWGYTYSGTAITENASIYTWNIDKKLKGELPEDRWVKKIRKVSSSDLERIKELAKSLDDTIELKQMGCDMGTSYTIVWDYSRHKKFTIYQGGDFSGQNDTKEALEIREIIRKYL